MKRNIFIITILCVPFVLLFSGCCCKRATSSSQNTKPLQVAGSPQAVPTVVIYKMTKDYSNHVPIILDENRRKIVSYPATIDIRDDQKPIKLTDGYWLDRRGINQNVVFLSFSYEQYAKLPTTPTPRELMESIIDRDPLIEIYQCGKESDYINVVRELNEKIRQNTGKLDKIFKSLK